MAMAAGIDGERKISLIGIILANSGMSNRQATGMGVKALRDANTEAHFRATAMMFPITLNEGGSKIDALYFCLEEPGGFVEDSIVTHKKRFFGGWKFAEPRTNPAEPRVFGPKGDELVALVGEMRITDSLPEE